LEQSASSLIIDSYACSALCECDAQFFVAKDGHEMNIEPEMIDVEPQEAALSDAAIDALAGLLVDAVLAEEAKS
jgi:hypothetical protein